MIFWKILAGIGFMLWVFGLFYISWRGIRKHVWEVGSEGEIIVSLEGKSAVIGGWCSLVFGIGVLVGSSIWLLQS
jgi:hypothetical protein